MKTLRIAIVGTFDVQNFGDLLFPLVAQEELSRRFDHVEVLAYSYGARTTPNWPYEVRSVSELPVDIASYDALLVGGGFLVRFDKDVAPGYGPPGEEIHHPTGYWLTPALMALAAGVPVIWNAPGMHDNVIPDWARSPLAMVLEQSAYVAVRDEPTRATLATVSDTEIIVVPDTVFGLGMVCVPTPSDEVQALRHEAGLSGPYVVVQAADSARGAVARLRANAHRFPNHRFLALPIGPVLGDIEEIVDGLPNSVSLSTWPSPMALAELIQGADAVIGHSYHLAITASLAGVSVFSPMPLDTGKFLALRDVETIHGAIDLDIDELVNALGRREISPALDDRVKAVRLHWDAIADVVREGKRDTGPSIGRLLQALPQSWEDTELVIVELQQARDSIDRIVEVDVRRRDAIAKLESQAIEAGERLLDLERSVDQQVAELERAKDEAERLGVEACELRTRAEEATGTAVAAAARSAELHRVLMDARRMIIDQHDAATAFHRSRSWRVTAPLRRVGARLGRPQQRPETLQLRALFQGHLQTHPFAWASISDVFTSDAAGVLSDSFPHDHFMSVCASGGEKDYSYEARELVPFGKSATSHAAALHPAWQAFVFDLLTPAYRQAMSALTGLDLSHAPMEVNATHFPVGGMLGPHRDLPDKLVAHLFYFNTGWRREHGGALRILGAGDDHEVLAELPPTLGSSAVLVRSEDSWHEVTPVAQGAPSTRRAVTVTFHRPESSSSMWPAGSLPSLHSVTGTADG